MSNFLLLSHHGYFLSRDGGLGVFIESGQPSSLGRAYKADLSKAFHRGRFTNFVENVLPDPHDLTIPGFGDFKLEFLRAPNSVVIVREGQYMCALPDGSVVTDRTVVLDWEQFILVSELDAFRLCNILGRSWIIDSTRALIGPEALAIKPGPCLAVGDLSLPLAWNLPLEEYFLPFRLRVKVDGWKFEQLIAFEPLIYYAAFGNDALQQFKLSLVSLFKIGHYDGRVIIYTEKSKQYLVDMLGGELMRNVVVVNRAATDWVGFVASRFAILEEEDAWSCSPVVYSDPDIIFNANIQDMLIDAACSRFPCAAHEHFSKLATSPSVGAELLNLDNERPILGCGFNAGTIALPNLLEHGHVFSLIRDVVVNLCGIYGRGFHKWVDQEVANYLSHKHFKFDTVALTKYMRYGWFADSLVLGRLSGFVHFCGIERTDRVGPMRHYLQILADHYGVDCGLDG